MTTEIGWPISAFYRQGQETAIAQLIGGGTKRRVLFWQLSTIEAFLVLLLCAAAERQAMNKEQIKMNWDHLWWLFPKIRSISRDRKGIFYWKIVEQTTDDLFTIRLIRWPGCSACYREAGWLSIGPGKDQISWTIYDIRVFQDYKHQGAGTTLVKAAIKLAKRAGARKLHAEVIQRDLEASPFLLTWYSRLGFAIHMEQGKNEAWPLLTVVATIRMDLDL